MMITINNEPFILITSIRVERKVLLLLQHLSTVLSPGIHIKSFVVPLTAPFAGTTCRRQIEGLCPSSLLDLIRTDSNRHDT